MKKISEQLWAEDGFLVKLRCDNYFDSEEYAEVKLTLLDNSKVWKENDSVPLDDMAALIGLIDQLAGGSRFYDEETAVKSEDACIEIEEIINNLL